MKKLLILFCAVFSLSMLTAQDDMSVEQLKEKKAEVQKTLDKAAEEAANAQKEIDALQKQINALSGWMTGFTGLVGFNLGGSDQWIANPNPTSRSTGLSIGLTAFANREQPKYFWNNKLIVNKAWQKVDLTGENESSLFDNGTVDLLNISSLAGYKLTQKLALSGLGEFNSSLGNFLQPATFDIGVGATWKPIANLVVVVHPLNYHIAWSAQDDVASQGALGAKLRADYQDNFLVAGRKIAWSTTLTSFLPYTSNTTTINDVDQFGVVRTDDAGEPITREAGLFNWSWLNTFSFQVWDGVGVGINLGLRDADFEFDGLQTYYGVGLTYTL